eukprot:CAMPEP_0181214552 /NCGR_PEP_ID=MMETSP1096-20121128/25520_1 /TAXON_ID=156174 ORGANISM="Chrysochromulina ericina, Strain CCMP281" /NCGR_SAMPLE_ID=MMETSP1096 /ASSEMBLY_ACC=CAM_ASM_000453 /LENGTH=59 /DNA_ID=CAMNT_0023306307 /DNA_START=440 /DNA_END=619 /DNA_ORIENTATION=-
MEGCRATALAALTGDPPGNEGVPALSVLARGFVRAPLEPSPALSAFRQQQKEVSLLPMK